MTSIRSARTGSGRSRIAVAPRPVERHLALHALELPLAGERPAERVLDCRLDVLGAEHAAGARHAADAARDVHGAAVPVAAAADRLADRDARAQLRELAARVVGGPDEG